MRHGSRVILSVLILLLMVTPTFAQQDTPPPQSETQPEGVTHVVQPGENMFRIALRYGTTVNAIATANGITNTRLIYVGQSLIIPVDQPDQQPPAPQPDPERTYTVQRGDSLYQIAVRNNTTVSVLIQLNNLGNANLIYPGQVLRLPALDGTVAPAPTEEPPGSGETEPQDTEPGEPEQPVVEEPIDPVSEIIPLDAGFAYGITVFFDGQNIAAVSEQIRDLGMEWVKVRADWRELEPAQGEYILERLDTIIETLDLSGINILLTVSNAPAWARTSPDENGPPDNLDDFAAFVTVLAERYAGAVDAYQIWDEPNLRRTWNCERRMCTTDYLDMLRIAYDTIKGIDPSTQVITAGLAPTRFNDRLNAIDDRLFLETMYSRAVTEISDGIGVHPGGWANPPDAPCCDQPEGVETHFESDVFYFLENLTAYREIMLRYNDSDSALWITKFGWGTSEDTDPPGEINVFVTYTDLAEQSLYVPRAFELAQELGYIGPMFLDNLNGCQSNLSTTFAELCYNSLISPDGIQRPAYNSVRSLTRSGIADEPVIAPGIGEPEPEDETEIVDETIDETAGETEIDEPVEEVDEGETGPVFVPIPLDTLEPPPDTIELELEETEEATP